MLINEITASRQSDPVSVGLGGERLNEEALEGLSRHAAAAITHGHLDVAPRGKTTVLLFQFHVSGQHVHVARAVHGLDAIDDEILQHLADLGCVNNCRPQILGQTEMDEDARAALGHSCRLADKRGKLGGFALWGKIFCESERLRGEGLRALRGCESLTDVLAHFALGAGFCGGQREMPADHADEIVDVMNNSSRHRGEVVIAEPPGILNI